MEREKAVELIEKYKDRVDLTFARYYKYEFEYSGHWYAVGDDVKEGIEVDVCYGGNSGDIYRYEVTTEPRKLESLDSLEGNYHRVRIVDLATGEKYEYSDY